MVTCFWYNLRNSIDKIKSRLTTAESNISKLKGYDETYYVNINDGNYLEVYKYYDGQYSLLRNYSLTNTMGDHSRIISLSHNSKYIDIYLLPEIKVGGSINGYEIYNNGMYLIWYRYYIDGNSFTEMSMTYYSSIFGTIHPSNMILI